MDHDSKIIVIIVLMLRCVNRFELALRGKSLNKKHFATLLLLQYRCYHDRCYSATAIVPCYSNFETFFINGKLVSRAIEFFFFGGQRKEKSYGRLVGKGKPYLNFEP